MGEFITYSSHEIAHGDGWSFLVDEYGNRSIRVVYREHDADSDEAKTISEVKGIWPESARKIAEALVALANQIDPPPAKEHKNSREFAAGFYAGLAYASLGPEAIQAASAADPEQMSNE